MDRSVVIVVIAAVFSINLSFTSLVYKDRNLYEGSNCTLQNGTEGVCSSKCPEMTSDETMQNRDTCGFVKTDVLFCCPVFEIEVKVDIPDSKPDVATDTPVTDPVVIVQTAVSELGATPSTEAFTESTPVSQSGGTVSTPAINPDVATRMPDPEPPVAGGIKYPTLKRGMVTGSLKKYVFNDLSTQCPTMADHRRWLLCGWGDCPQWLMMADDRPVSGFRGGSKDKPVFVLDFPHHGPLCGHTHYDVCKERIEKHQKRLIIENEINIRKVEGIKFYNDTRDAYVKLGPSRREAIKKECEEMSRKIGGNLGFMYKTKCKFLLPNIDLAIPSAVHPAHLNEHPHMAAIGWYDSDTDRVDWNCGGTLIHPSYVVTAAHCIFNIGEDNPPRLVRLGDINLVSLDDDEYLYEYQILQMFIHYEYKKQQFYNDIAMLQIEPFESSLRQVRPLPACVWTELEIPEKVLMMGYGAPAFGKKHLDKLYQGNLTVLDNVECGKLYDSNPDLPDGIIESQICALDPEGILDTCEGDSGGPLQFSMNDELQTPYLVGLTSFGVLCLDGNPGVYTRLYSYLDWIETVISQSN